MTSAGAAHHLRSRPEVLAGGGDSVEVEYAKDTWDAFRLGVPARRGHNIARFGVIRQEWLREAIKRWSRFRLGAGYSFTTIDTGAQSLARLSMFLAEHPEVDGFADLTREVLEQFLAWMAISTRWSTNTRHHTLTFVKVLLDWGHRHGTLPGLPPNAVIYEEEVSRPPDQLPRFIPEFVMNQLESEANLARLRNPTVRHLVVLLMETGLRGGDACALAFNPLIEDSVGWPCLRFDNAKVGTEQLIPLSARAAAAIRAQQAHVLKRWPQGSPWLFPGISENPDGTKPYAHGSLSHQLGNWQKAIEVRDEAGQPVRIHAHQFRHTVGTRLINAGVPQHVIQKLLGHASPRMTARYAQIHDRTIRDAFERYCAQRVNVAGHHLDHDPDALTADAEWVKHNLARIRDSLPNGYCGRPPQQDCPHPNACLTCPDFQTTPEFLDIHRRQADTNRRLIARAHINGQFRLAENLQQVQASLERIIPALEAIQDGEAVTRADNTRNLIRAAAARHDLAVARARAAIQTLDRAAQPLTFTAVARAAGVSRGWLYNQPDLRNTISRLRRDRPATPVVPSSERATPASLRQRLDDTRTEIARLRAENAILREQLAHHLGEERARR